MTFDLSVVRRQFPILSREIGEHPLIYLDTAATAQKPQAVIDAVTRFYGETNANINRGVHPLAEAATVAYENARRTVQKFLNAASAHEIVFVRNATEGINVVARTFGDAEVKKDDVIVLTTMEHHANIVPWMQLCKRTGATIEWLKVGEDGSLDLKSLEKNLQTKHVKLVSITGLSNVLGALTPIRTITTLAHAHDAKVLIDASQLVVHSLVDVQTLDCDFLVFSGHKLYGPMGIGVLYGKSELLHAMPPFLGGGDMIASVTTEGFTPAELPRKFEAGTPSVADAIGLGAAIEWLTKLDRRAIELHERALLTRARSALKKIKGIRILGPAEPTGCISFAVDGVHPHDITEALGRKGICLRGGHHCCQPLHESLKLKATTRLSVGLYNTEEEIDRCIAAIEEAKELLCKE